MSELNKKENEKEVGFMWNNLISEILWICAGVNRPVLRQCPTEWAKYAGIGGTILFTALMAMLSGGYALYTVFHNETSAIFFGVFWGLLIFNLDRFIVNTMYSDGKATISWMELASGMPRIIMAIFLGLVISTPLELKIFEDKINWQIEQDQVAAMEEINNGMMSYQEKKNQLVARKDSINRLIAGEGPALKTIYDDEIKRQEIRVDEARNAFEKETYGRGNTHTAGYGPVAKQREKALNDELSRLDELIVKQHEARDQAIKIGQSSRGKWQIEVLNYESQIARIDSIVSTTADKQTIAAKSLDGFTARYHALSEITQSDSALSLARIIISLLFIIIETAPTFFKMMLEDGPYDDMLRAEEYRIKILADKRISDINDEVNTAVSISSERNKNQIQQQLLANQALLEQLSKAQSEVLAEAIDLWKQKELEKVRENPESYISMERGSEDL